MKMKALVLRSVSTATRVKPCFEVGTGVKPWTFARSAGRNYGWLVGATDGVEIRKLPGTVRGEP